MHTDKSKVRTQFHAPSRRQRRERRNDFRFGSLLPPRPARGLELVETALRSPVHHAWRFRSVSSVLSVVNSVWVWIAPVHKSSIHAELRNAWTNGWSEPVSARRSG